MSVATVTLHDGRQVRLGKRPPVPGKAMLRFGDYLRAGAVSPPASVDYTAKAMNAINQMYGNDVYGDCVIAGHMHSVGIWSGNETGTPVVGTTDEAVNNYHTICGPGDNGCVISEVLDYMQSTGLSVGGQPHKIAGYVSIDWTNQTEVKAALYIFGTITIGVQLPSAWESAPSIWDVTNTGIVGGHDITGAAYNSTGVVIATWGGLRTITWAAFLSKQWLDEAYVPLGLDWYSANNLDPMGVDVATLQADLQDIQGGNTPPIPNPPTPTPPIPTPTPTPPPPTPSPVAGTLWSLDPNAKVAYLPAGIAHRKVGTPQVVLALHLHLADLPLGWTAQPVTVSSPPPGMVSVDPAGTVYVPSGVTPVHQGAVQVILGKNHELNVPPGFKVERI